MSVSFLTGTSELQMLGWHQCGECCILLICWFYWIQSFCNSSKTPPTPNCKDTGSLKAAVWKLRCVNASPEWRFPQHCEIWFFSLHEKEFCLCFGWSWALPTHAAGAVYKQLLFVHISSYPAVQIKLPISAIFLLGFLQLEGGGNGGVCFCVSTPLCCSACDKTSPLLSEPALSCLFVADICFLSSAGISLTPWLTFDLLIRQY